MIIYLYDEVTGEFLGADTTEIDFLKSQKEGRNVYLMPPNSTTIAPPNTSEKEIAVWEGDVWVVKEDHRKKLDEDSGTPYWLEGDTWETPPRYMTEIGTLPEGAMLEPPEPTQEEIAQQLQQEFTNLIQTFLDSKAQELNYDSCLSVCSYIDTGVPKFDAEGKAFRAWRSAVWAKGYEILAQVQSGERGIPTQEELFAELPELIIDYAET